MERIRLKLQGFKFTVEYLPGALNPSDYASRHPNINDGKDGRDELSAYVNEIILKNRVADIVIGYKS